MDQMEVDEIIEYLQETEETLDTQDMDEDDKEALLAELGDIIERFEEKIERIPECGCHIYKGGQKHPHGYGGFYMNGKMEFSHRAAYILFNGEIEDGLCVLHRCDMPQCVNPDHLFLGTQRDNMVDMRNKGRASDQVGTWSNTRKTQ